MSTETEDFLEHFGVKGMKWGVRHKVGSDGLVERAHVHVRDNATGQITSGNIESFKKEKVKAGLNFTEKSSNKSYTVVDKKTREPDSKDHTETSLIRNRAAISGTRALSNQEIQTAINRMNLEQQYSRLSPAKVSKGKQVTSATLKNVGSITANVSRSVATQYATQYVKKALDGAIKNAAK